MEPLRPQPASIAGALRRYQWITMTKLKTIALAICLITCAANARAADACLSRAETQRDLNRCASLSYDEADKALNDLYKRIIKDYADDPRFIEKLRASQRAWLKFRDAEMDALFPHKDDTGYYGSVLPMCQSSWLATLTRQRIDQLRKWSNRIDEGDACAGSIKFKD